MPENSLVGHDLREETLLACYFFYGEETHPVEEFVGQIRELVGQASPEDFHVERYYLDDARWHEIIDTARTVPFLFNPWRVLLVWFPERKPGPERSYARKRERGENGGKGARFLSAADQKILNAYFAEPPARTVLVVIQPGKVRRDDAVVRFFSSLPKSAVLVKEVKPLSAYQAKKWAERRAYSLGKTLTEGAKDRLFEVVGSDLRLLANELDKLAVYCGEKKVIDREDIDSVTAWARSFETYELDDVLIAGDYAQALVVLNRLFTDGITPEQIVDRIAAFFRNVLSAKTSIREKSKGRKEIFSEFFPGIKESFQDLYRRKFNGFFGVVDGLSSGELNSVLSGLQRVDWKIKTTDGKAETALTVFLKEYSLAKKREKAISAD